MRRLEDEYTMNEIYDQLPEPLKSLAEMLVSQSRSKPLTTWTRGTNCPHPRWMPARFDDQRPVVVGVHEGDLEHTGDELEELLEEELVELDWEGRSTFRHFRNDLREYVFSCEWPSVAPAEVSVALQAMVAMFTELGDMGGEDEED